MTRDFCTQRRFPAAVASLVIALSLAACGSAASTAPSAVTLAPLAKLAALRLPHTGPPSECNLGLAHSTAIIVFQGDGHSVAGACAAWVRSAARQGATWTANIPGGFTQNRYARDGTVCRLQARNGWEYATVLDGPEDHMHAGKSACAAFNKTGRWRTVPLFDSLTYELGQRPPANPPVPAGTPELSIRPAATHYHWSGREPSELGFSGDAGNVVTNLRWALWIKTRAFGIGESMVQSCIPFCVTGVDMPVTAYIILSDPVHGRFTHLTEYQGGWVTHDSYMQKLPLNQTALDHHVGFWPQYALGYEQARKQWHTLLEYATRSGRRL